MVTLKILTHSGNNSTGPVPEQTQLSAFTIGVAGMACFHQHLSDSKIRMSGFLFNTELITIAPYLTVPKSVSVQNYIICSDSTQFYILWKFRVSY